MLGSLGLLSVIGFQEADYRVSITHYVFEVSFVQLYNHSFFVNAFEKAKTEPVEDLIGCTDDFMGYLFVFHL